MKLFDGEIGKKYRVSKFKLEERIKRRFEVLGLTLGADVEVVSKKRYGGMIIRVRGTRFAIGKKFGEGIIVYESR